MKNSSNPSAAFNLATSPAGSLSLALCVALASQGAWSATCPTRPACTVAQNNFSGNLAAGQSLCISGTFTGNINNLAAGATIFVPAGATFNPASLQNPAGSVINCGSATLPSITLNNGFSFSNHGTADFKSNINWNGKGTFFNDAGARMNLRTTFQMKGNSTITNDGEILSSGDFSSEPGTSITNTGYIRISGGNFNPDGTVINSGFVQTDEFININPNSELINNCSFISQKGFNNNSPKTRNNGFIFVTGVGNNNDLVQNNKPFTQGPNAVVVGTRFFNSAAITGSGKYYFTGDTRNQAAFGDDGSGINFYDTTRTTGKIFDVQAPAPHSSVTANAFTPPKVDAVVPSCSKNVAPVKPVITINIIAGDDIINAQEDDSPVTVNGATTDAPNGSLIQLEINGKTYTTTVSNNSWNLLIPAADAQLFDASETVSAQAALADNSAVSEKATRAVAHIVELPSVTINAVASDDIINSIEDDAPVVINGTSTVAENGSIVSVQINGKNYTAIVTNNSWSFNLPAADAQSLKANETITAKVTNAQGNVSPQATRPIKHSTELPSLTIAVVAGDDIINAQEDDSDLIISGTSQIAENGSTVAITLNGKNYTAIVNNNGWSAVVPAADAQLLHANEIITAKVTNLAGDVSAPASRAISHSSVIPLITINTIAGDDIINLTEDDTAVLISGTTTWVENGQSVALNINGKNYQAVVNNSSWSTSISAADAQSLRTSELVSAQVSNIAGDSALANRTVRHSTAEPSVDIDVIAGDDIINTLEDNSPVLISGTTSLVENGQPVKITINNKTYTATVNNDRWQVSLPAADAQALHADERVTAIATNLAGDKSEPASRDIQHSLNDPTLTINIVAGDDIINSSEDDLPVVISGTSTLVDNGQKVTLTINGKTYTAVVNNNAWSVAISASDAQALRATEVINATVSNSAGDKATADHTISHSTDIPAITINPIAGDDIINASEDDVPVLISGKTTLVEDGAKASVAVNGKNYDAVVSNNSWSILMPAVDAQALGTSEKVIATVSNKAGDKASAERSVTHSGTAPTIGINVIAGDDIINTAEDDAPVAISGKTTLIEDGQTVTLIINSKNYAAVVTNNSWSTSIAAIDAQALKISEKVVASASNKAGDLAEGERTITHSLVSPTVTINPIAGDDIINSGEDDAPVIVSGKTTQVEDGAKVIIAINGKTYEALVNNNSWSISMPAADAQALDAAETVNASVINKAGDKATADRALTHSGTAPTITINVIAGDDIINASEDDAPVLISGTTAQVENASQVSVTINGKTYTANVTNNNWSLVIPALDAQALGAAEKVAATVTNNAGDTATANRAITHSGTAPTVTINIVAGDDIINSREDDAVVAISGKTTLIEDGQKVTLLINGKVYEAVIANNTWSTSIPALDAQALKASEKIIASANNKAGDKAEGERTISHSLIAPTIKINPIAGDDIINASEDDAPVAVTGTTTLVEDGEKVTVTVNGKTYTATVSNNSWSILIPALDAQALGISETVNASVTNKAGDTANADRALTHSGTTPTIKINTIAGDDVVNTSEDDAPIAISGTSTLIEDGQNVALLINGKNYTAQVSNNSWSTSISAADAQQLKAVEKVAASASNKAGDKAEAERSIAHSINSPTVSINVIAGDDIINASEDDAPVLISGTTTLVEDGAKVSFTVNGKNYEAIVNNNSWSAMIPAADASSLDTKEIVTATVTNKAGDKASTDRAVTHSGTAPTVSINVIAGDDIINTTEDDAPVTISGKTTLAEDGAKVSININGKTYEAIVADNSWATIISAADAQALDSSESVSATVSNNAGDKANAERALSHSSGTPKISINVIAGDDIINTSEDDDLVAITGTTTDVEDGQSVTLNINGKTYTAIVANNSFSSAISAADAQALPASTAVIANVRNQAGDAAKPADRTVQHSLAAPSIIINPVAGDDIINATEDDSPVIINGKTTLIEDGQKISVEINGKNYSATVNNNNWAITLPAADAQALDTTEIISAQVINKAGDSAQVERAVSHSVNLPTIAINVIAGDDIINNTEDNTPVLISGSTTNAEDNSKVSLKLNGKTYNTQVQDGRWSLFIPADDAQQLAAVNTAIAQVSNLIGDTSEPAERSVAHSQGVPTISINTVAGDDIINLTEDDAPVAISGDTYLAENGSEVVVTLNGNTYKTVVKDDTWNLLVPAADAQALDASETVTAVVTNKAGDTSDLSTRSIFHSTAKPAINIDIIAGDDIINAEEDDAPVEIHGTTLLVEDGQAVTLTINGKTYSPIVNNNSWTINIPAADVQAFDKLEPVQASVINNAGDESGSAVRDVLHSPDKPAISIDVIAGDDIINNNEDDAPVWVRGKTTLVEDGQIVSLDINGKTYTATVGNNNWAAVMPAADAQALGASVTATANVVNAAGDSARADRAINHSVSTPTISINPVAGDDIINSTEDDAPVVISGNTTLIEDGEKISLSVNDKTYTTTAINNSWSIAVPAADAQALPAAEIISAQAINIAGDKAETQRAITHSNVAPTISIKPIAGDDIINAMEDDAPVLISGTTTQVEDGAKIEIIINGKTYETVVNNNNWSVLVPVQDVQALNPTEQVSASVTNKAGDEAEVSRTLTHSVNSPTISIAPVTGDDIINTAEDDTAVLISGTTALIEDGQILTLVINGKNYTATINNNAWLSEIPAADAQALKAVETVQATASNKAGDAASNQRIINHSLINPSILINPIAGDDVINSLEDDAAILISGKTTLVENGAQVSLVINGKTYTAPVSENNWLVEIPVADVQALDAVETVTASVINKAGDKADAAKIVNHSINAPTIVINPVAVDDIINGEEDNSPIAISGTTTLVEDGQELTLVINSKNYSATVANNSWSVAMPAADAQALAASEQITAVVLNKAGDKADAAHTIIHSVNAPSISINPIAGDDIINAQEDEAPVLISGTTTLVEDGAKIVITINGKTYEALVTDNNWSVLVPVADVQALDTTEQVTASVTNKAGDTAEVNRALTHSSTTPTVIIEPIAIDDIINSSEDDAPIIINGKTTAVEDGQTLTLVVNGKNYSAIVTNNNWSVTLPAADAQALPASENVSASVSNKAGDEAEASRALTHIGVRPTIVIDPVAGDDIINATEDDAPVVVSGKTTGVDDGTPLVISVNGKDYTTTVTNNQWSIAMPAADAQALAESSVLVAKVTTTANDSAQASKPLTHFTNPAAITLSPITGDNLITSLEDNDPITIQGTTSGVENGARVTFELNDAQYEALVNNNQWSFELPQAAAEALQPDNTAHAQVTNAQGDFADATAVVKHVAWEDSDGDGLSDDVEGKKDSDKDGVPDYRDLDSDNDGLLDEDEILNVDTDKNGNGIPDSFDATSTKGADNDGDGIDDRFDADVPGQPKGIDKNNDGIRDNAPVRDNDGDGLPDYVDLDSDNDAVPDLYEVGGSQYDSNGDGRADGKDTDGDGLLDVFDPSSGNEALVAKDADEDGIADPLDLDSDNDGLPDITEDAIGVPDPDGDGLIGTVPFKDSDNDGLGDAADINSGGKLGVRLDSDFNGTSDGQSTDRDGDGISDIEESVGKTQAQILDPDGDGHIGTATGTGSQKPNNNGTPVTGGVNVSAIANKDTNGNGISDGIEEQLTRVHIPVPTSNAQAADFDRDGYPDWIEVRYGGNPLDNAEADRDGDGIPDWVENTDLLLDNQNDTDADSFVDLLEQVQGTDAKLRNTTEELFDAALKNLLNPSRYEGRSLKPVIWVDIQQGRQTVAALGNLNAEGIFNGDAQFSAKIGNYHVFGDPRDPQTVPVYDWSGSSPEVLALANDTHGALLSFDPTRLAAGQYQVTASVTLAGHRSTTVQRFQVAASPVADQDRDHIADAQDQQDANQGLLQAIPAQNGQLVQAAAITLVNNSEQLDHAVRLRLGSAAQAIKAGQARLTPDEFSQFGTSIGNSKYRTQSNETFTYAQVYDIEVTNLPSVGGAAEVVIPLAQPIGANLHLQRFNPLTGWQAFAATGGDEIASASGDASGLCPAPGSSLYEPGLNGGDSCLLVRVSDGGANDGDNNDAVSEDGQGDVNGLIQLTLTLAQDTPKQQAPAPAAKGKIQTGLKGRGGAFGWLFLAFTPALLIFRRRKHHDQAR
ncbi:MAG TPA: Ig-like domain-containing protein [Cellvibrionaceae bacterium]